MCALGACRTLSALPAEFLVQPTQSAAPGTWALHSLLLEGCFCMRSPFLSNSNDLAEYKPVHLLLPAVLFPFSFSFEGNWTWRHLIFIFLIIFLLHLSLFYVSVCRGPCEELRDMLEESVLWYSVGLGDRAQGTRLGKQMPLPAEPSFDFFPGNLPCTK